jgi:hypothetical protein
MIERFRKGSYLEKAAWIAILLLALFIPVAFALRLNPPSSWFGWSGESAAEWLGWIGLLALAFAIWQLYVTEGAARASEKAVQGAMSRVENFDLSMDLNSVVQEMQYAQDCFGSQNFRDAHLSCERAANTVLLIRRYYSRLREPARQLVDEAWRQLGSASSAARTAQQNGLDQEMTENLIGTLRDLRAGLGAVVASLRVPNVE